MPLPESPNASSETLTPARTVLIVVDVQRYFVNPE
jgi:isochorismate hydrolase